MKILILAPCMAAIVAITAGCGGIRTLVNPSGPGGSSSSFLAVASRKEPLIRYDRNVSWMSPGTKGKDLLYVSDAGSDDVYVFALPSRKVVGKLTGFDQPQGECSDSSGNVFITNTQKSEILEFAHGGTKRIQTLKDPGYYPAGCSVDGTTGNLAVTNIFAKNGNYGSVALFKNASGNPTQYTDSDIYYYYFCGYDDEGNLYLDGYSPDSTFAFAEFSSSSGTFLNIALNQAIYFPGTVQWTGKWVMVGDQEYEQSDRSVLYEFKIDGSGGLLEDFTALTGARDVVQAWLQNKTAYAPDSEQAKVGFYHYPAGGNPFADIQGLSTPIGSTISESSSLLRRSAYAAVRVGYQ